MLRVQPLEEKKELKKIRQRHLSKCHRRTKQDRERVRKRLSTIAFSWKKARYQVNKPKKQPTLQCIKSIVPPALWNIGITAMYMHVYALRYLRVQNLTSHFIISTVCRQ